MITRKRMASIFSLFLLFFGISNISFAQSESPFTLAAGTKIRLRMDNEINSKISSAKDTFTATLAAPFIVREVEVIPAGAVFEGIVLSVKPASAGKKDGQMNLQFKSLRLPNGIKRDIDASYVNSSTSQKDSNAFEVLAILGGASGGAAIGGAANKGKGALIGAGIGGAIGTLTAFLRKGKEMRIKADEEFEIRLNKEVTLPAEGF